MQAKHNSYSGNFKVVNQHESASWEGCFGSQTLPKGALILELMKLFCLVLAVLCVSVQSHAQHLRGEKEQKEPKVQSTQDTQGTEKPNEDTSHDEAPLKPLANNDEPAVGAKEVDPVNKAPVAPGNAPSVPEPVGIPVPEVPEKAQDTPGDAPSVPEPVGIPVPEVPEKARDTDLPKSEEEELDALGGDDGSEYEQYNFVSHPHGGGCRRWVNCRRGWYGNVRCNGGRYCTLWRWVSQGSFIGVSAC